MKCSVNRRNWTEKNESAKREKSAECTKKNRKKTDGMSANCKKNYNENNLEEMQDLNANAKRQQIDVFVKKEHIKNAKRMPADEMSNKKH